MKFSYYIQLRSGKWEKVNCNFYNKYDGNKKKVFMI